MLPRILLAAAALLGALGLSPAFAASSVQLLTPQSVAVAGGETRTFSVRFFDAVGNPSVGELIHFSNDVCGTFANGLFNQDVRTDASGMASVDFKVTITPGVTCWVMATSGVTARFDVITYAPSTVGFTFATNPGKPLPTLAYDFSVTAWVGGYRLDEVEIGARVIAGTANATLSAASATTGQDGTANFRVTPDARIGDYQIEVSLRGKTQRYSFTAPANPWQDLWWSGSAENGWGMSLVQHGDTFFSVIYAYDADGKATWYVMPGGTWSADHTTYSGAIYSPRGAPYSTYDASRLVVGAPLGNARLTLNGIDSATLEYTVGGVSGAKALRREGFGITDTASGADYGDMWWGGASQNGWGIAVLQQYRSLFAVWFTYDASGAPTWFVMPAGGWTDASTWEGHIYRTTGSPWVGRPYDASKLVVADVGGFRLRFGANSATFEYLVDGRNGSMALVRQPF